MSSSSFDPNKEIAELKTKLAELESELKTKLAELESELKTKLAELESELKKPERYQGEYHDINQKIVTYASKLPQKQAPPDIYLPIISWLTGKEFPATWSTSAAYLTTIWAVPSLLFGSIWRGRLAFFYFRMNRAILPDTEIAKYLQQYHLGYFDEMAKLKKRAKGRELRWGKDAAKAVGQGVCAFLGVMWSHSTFFAANSGNK